MVTQQDSGVNVEIRAESGHQGDLYEVTYAGDGEEGPTLLKRTGMFDGMNPHWPPVLVCGLQRRPREQGRERCPAHSRSNEKSVPRIPGRM